jgi:hypothetical protein
LETHIEEERKEEIELRCIGTKEEEEHEGSFFFASVC